VLLGPNIGAPWRGLAGAEQAQDAGSGECSCGIEWRCYAVLELAVCVAPRARVPDGGGVLLGPDIGAPWRGLAGAARDEDAAPGE
jgi:hypothetical protein